MIKALIPDLAARLFLSTEICLPNNSRAQSYPNVNLSPLADFNKRREAFTSSGGILHAHQQPDDEPTVLKEYKM